MVLYLLAGLFFLIVWAGLMIASGRSFAQGEKVGSWFFPGFIGCVFGGLGVSLLVVAVFGYK
uniref:Uncharacterized protein n=1 Tax=Acetobacter pasteurianus TaxID=438 RepID=I3W090_ACEPA|nr:hypothetical protein [Acetobacter pasteurianus]AFK89017.1 hypothetical protein [Acetobacter pasteurianus]